ncbi:MAG: PepSY domain-containing protein [Roseovarius sp.]|nr:PepSY domain-containing protein [Roseovarius sp.]
MKHLMSLALAGLLAMPAFAAHDDDHPDAETIARIEALLADMDCQMDPDDIEFEDGVYDLDDVICKGGKQYDIKLNVNFEVIEQREE